MSECCKHLRAVVGQGGGEGGGGKRIVAGTCVCVSELVMLCERV